jgi:hypothetical protein
MDNDKTNKQPTDPAITPPRMWSLYQPNAGVEPRRGSDVDSNPLFGVSVARVDGFRSQPTVNTDEDMVRVVLDMPKDAWRKLKSIIPPNVPPHSERACER